MVLFADQFGDLSLRFGPINAQMVVAFTGRTVAFTAKMGNVNVSVLIRSAKNVSFFCVHPHKCHEGSEKNILVQSSIVVKISYKTGFLQFFLTF